MKPDHACLDSVGATLRMGEMRRLRTEQLQLLDDAPPDLPFAPARAVQAPVPARPVVTARPQRRTFF